MRSAFRQLSYPANHCYYRTVLLFPLYVALLQYDCLYVMFTSYYFEGLSAAAKREVDKDRGRGGRSAQFNHRETLESGRAWPQRTISGPNPDGQERPRRPLWEHCVTLHKRLQSDTGKCHIQVYCYHTHHDHGHFILSLWTI